MSVVTFGLVLLWWSISSVLAAPVRIYVSPQGSDSNSGREATQPLRSLQHAVDMLQQNGVKNNAVFIELMEGYHDLPATLNFNRPITETVVIRAFQGQEVHVSGGQRLDSSLFHHVTDPQLLQRLPQKARSKVLQLDLVAAGINSLGTLATYGFYHLWKAPLELFINGRPLRLAQWPNEDKFTNITSVPDGGTGRRFTYNAGGRDTKWAQETEPWVYGWWYWSWADSSLPVANIDPDTHTITLAEDSQFGLREGHYNPDRSMPQVGFSKQGGYFRVINMLCELDQPGEYYIDRANKKLYVWPNTPLQTLTSSDTVYGSMLDTCISISNLVRGLHLEDFTVENCRQYGVSANAVRDLTFGNMEFRNTGSFGIICWTDCRNVSVLASEFHDVGGGVRITGGNRTTLEPSGVTIRDNHMWDFSRIGAIPGDAIHVEGVHTTVAYNHLHHGQYTAIRWAGNDHVFEYNDIHHVCFNSSDCGAIHSGRDWTFRGNVIRYNHIHETLRYLPGADVRGIMLDDEYASVLIEHNVFYNNQVHVNIGGGRDNVIRDNVMYRATSYSIQVDGRGLGSGGHGSTLHQRLQASPYQTDLWRTRYPELANILQKHPEAPEGNEIYRNVIYNPTGSGVDTMYYGGNNLRRNNYFDVHNNKQVYRKTDFTNPDFGDFTLRCDVASWVGSTHFKQPVRREEVGPRVPTGPYYLRATRPAAAAFTTKAPVNCDQTTLPPATTTPRVSYLPDGSAPNTLYPDIPQEGCWFDIDHCPSHPNAEGKYKDNTGTATGTEEGCLASAGPQWRWCGSPSDGKVFAVYGPTGAMTFAGEGCYYAEWGDGCNTNHPGFHRDEWAEQNVNAANDEQACLKRSSGQWPWCGSHADQTITSVYGPTGNFRTAGAGCWIKIVSCPAQQDLQGYFYDAWGATNHGSDDDQARCFERANEYWTQCGSHDDAPVTAFFRPKAVSFTVP